MKRITLLFLALSSLTFAAAYPSGTANVSPSTSTTQDTAGININVSAIVTTSTSTQLEIVDETGTQISAVNFYHMLNQDNNNNLTGDVSLNQTIYAKAPGLTEARKNKLSNNTLDTFTGTNDSKFNSKVEVHQEEFDTTINGVKYTLTSTASATGQLTIGEVIEAPSQTLIFTYDKTK
ncbi:MAG: hypothetical protein ACRC8F_07810 [Cetobacterium sp.]